MKKQLTHSDVLLGGPDAWDHLESPYLEENFLPIQQFSDILGDAMTFLCGRRGSGKSAIARMLESRSVLPYRKSIEGEWSQYGEYMNIVQALTQAREGGANIDIRQAVRRLWTWVLPVIAMQVCITRSEEAGEVPDSSLQRMREYFNSLPPITIRSTIGHILSHTFMRAQALLDQGAFNTFLLDLVNSSDFLSAVAALQQRTQRRGVLVVFDTLESYKIFQDYMVEGIQGVLEAVVAFLADERMHGVSVKFFIPAEIYDNVISEFPGKVNPRAVFMRWRAADIVALLAKRYLSVLKRVEAVTPSELITLEALVEKAYQGHDGRHLRQEFWYANRFLPKMITNRVGGEEECFPYMLRHTFRRPRDLITAQMQSIVNLAVDREEFPFISQKTVVEGVHDDKALRQVLGDALSPYENNIPGQLVAAARTSFYGRSVIMSGRELKRFASELYNLKPISNVNADLFVQMLLQCGVIGLVNDPKSLQKGPYCTARFEYLMQGRLPLAERETYCVHPVMADLFRMTVPSGQAVVYPMPERDLWLEGEAKIS